MNGRIKERQIVILQLSNGRAPFEDWYESLDCMMQRAVDARLTRISAGNFGDHKSVGDGVFELRIPRGPGLRVYYGIKGEVVVVLLGGGDKRSQRRDIAEAKERLKQYLNEWIYEK